MEDLRKYETMARIMTEAEDRSQGNVLKEEAPKKNIEEKHESSSFALNENMKRMMKSVLFNEEYPLMVANTAEDKTPDKIKKASTLINTVSSLIYQIQSFYFRSDLEKEITKPVIKACEDAVGAAIYELNNLWKKEEEKEKEEPENKILKDEKPKEEASKEEASKEEIKKEVEEIKDDTKDLVNQIMSIIKKQESIESPMGDILIAESINGDMVSVLNKTKLKRQTVDAKILLNWKDKAGFNTK